MPLSVEAIDHLVFGGLDKAFRKHTEMQLALLAREYGTSDWKTTLEAHTQKYLAPKCINAWHYLGIEGPALPEELLIVPSRHIAVCVVPIEGKTVLVLHSGFMEVLAFTHAIDILFRFADYSPTYSADIDSEVSLHMAKFNVIRHALADPSVEIPHLEQEFPSSLENPWSREMMAMWAFVFAHELAHVRLHHGTPPLPDTRQRRPHLLLEEPLHFLKREEFEADEYAVRSATRNKYLASVGVYKFLGHLSVIEAAFGRFSGSHPHALNRLAHLRPLLAEELSGIDAVIDGLEQLYTRYPVRVLVADQHESGFDVIQSVDAIETFAWTVCRAARREGPSYLPPHYPDDPPAADIATDQRIPHLRAKEVADFHESQFFARIASLQSQIGSLQDTREIAACLRSLDLSKENDFSPLVELHYLLIAEALFVEIHHGAMRRGDQERVLRRIFDYGELRYEVAQDASFWLEYHLLKGMIEFQEHQIANAKTHLREFARLAKPFCVPADADYVKRMRKHIAARDLEAARARHFARLVPFFQQHFADISAALARKVLTLKTMAGEADNEHAHHPQTPDG